MSQTDTGGFLSLQIILTTLASVATAIGVCIAGFQLLRSRRQEMTTFEDVLSRDYRAIALTLPIAALLGGPLLPDELEQELKHFWHYFDLCNEQVFLWQEGRISESTWKLWCDGIRSNMQRPAFNAAWEEVKARLQKNGNKDFSELRSLEDVTKKFTADSPMTDA